MVLGASGAFGQAVFVALGDLEGGSAESVAMAVSADGRVVCGFASSAASGAGQHEAWVWTEGAGLTGLGFLGGGQTESQAVALSADGQVIVGSSGSALVVPPSREGFVLRGSGGMQGMGVLGDGATASSAAAAVNAAGTAVVGSAPGANGTVGYLWGELGFVVLDGADGDWFVVARGVSGDGDQVVGYATTVGGQRARVWRRGEGWGAGSLFEGEGAALASTPDGSVVTGRLGGGQDQELLRWTTDAGAVGLGRPGGSRSPSGWGLSGDGGAIVGSAVRTGSGEQGALVWVEGEAPAFLEEWLAERFGLEAAGWRLEVARGMSADGRVIVGWGTNPRGETEAWLVRLPWLRCRADVNADGRLDAGDVLAFADDFGRGEADWDGNGRTDTRDFIGFLRSFAGGC
jgi:probable HAF family extracellular repeat protein